MLSANAAWPATATATAKFLYILLILLREICFWINLNQKGHMLRPIISYSTAPEYENRMPPIQIQINALRKRTCLEITLICLLNLKPF